MHPGHSWNQGSRWCCSSLPHCSQPFSGIFVSSTKQFPCGIEDLDDNPAFEWTTLSDSDDNAIDNSENSQTNTAIVSQSLRSLRLWSPTRTAIRCAKPRHTTIRARSWAHPANISLRINNAAQREKFYWSSYPSSNSIQAQLTDFRNHMVTPHSKLRNSAQKFWHSKLTVLLWELRSRISNDSRRIGLKKATNSMSAQGLRLADDAEEQEAMRMAEEQKKREAREERMAKEAEREEQRRQRHPNAPKGRPSRRCSDVGTHHGWPEEACVGANLLPPPSCMSIEGIINRTRRPAVQTEDEISNTTLAASAGPPSSIPSFLPPLRAPPLQTLQTLIYPRILLFTHNSPIFPSSSFLPSSDAPTTTTILPNWTY